MHIDIRGAGPPLVLIHGWAMHGGVFAPLLAELETQLQCWLVDLPGHGLSPAREGLALDACAEQLARELPRASVLGWSMGGAIALRLATLQPERIERLIAIAASPCFVRQPDWPHGVEPRVFAEFGAALAQDYRGTIERFLALEVLGDEKAREELRFLRHELDARPPPAAAVLEEGLRLLDASDQRAALPHLACPSLWISGQRDRLVPWTAMQAAAALAGLGAAQPAGAGRWLNFPSAGHAPFLTRPREVANAILEFVLG